MQSIRRNPGLPVKHPGVTFNEKVLKRNNLTVDEVALQLRIAPAFLESFIEGKKDVTSELAKKLEGACGISADFWLNKQHSYDAFILHNKQD